MKINDIINEAPAAYIDWEKSDSSDSIDAESNYMHYDIAIAMRNQGYTKLGNGMDQTAYLAPNGQVLKLFKTNQNVKGGFSRSQYMCVDWIKYCKANKSNRFLPKFSNFASFEFPPKSGQMYLQIRMEFLGKFPMDWQYELAEMAGAVESGTELDEYLDGRMPEDYDHEESTATMAISLGMKGLQQLWTTLEQLHKICESNGWGWDLHSGNFMIRNDGTPVIVDPYFLGSDRID